MSWMTAEAGQGEQGGDHQADALARARRCEGQHVLGAFMAQVLRLEQAEEHASWPRQSGLAHLIRGPARRAVGRDLPGLRARQMAMPMATTNASRLLPAAMLPPTLKTSGA